MTRHSKTPIWERQGRPKPPRIATPEYQTYEDKYGRVCLGKRPAWRIDGRVAWTSCFGKVEDLTFHEAIKYLDASARGLI